MRARASARALGAGEAPAHLTATSTTLGARPSTLMLYTPPPKARAAWRRPHARPFRAGRPEHAGAASPLQRSGHARRGCGRARCGYAGVASRAAACHQPTWPECASLHAPASTRERRHRPPLTPDTVPELQRQQRSRGRACRILRTRTPGARLGGKRADACALRRAGRPVEQIGDQHAAGRQRSRAVAQERARLAPKQAPQPCTAAMTALPPHAARRRPRPAARPCGRAGTLLPCARTGTFGRMVVRCRDDDSAK